MRKFVVMKHATEYVRGLRYKLRSMGIPVEECCYIYGDNKFVLVNSSTLHSQLEKKSNSVTYHQVREGSALDEWRVTYINTHDNPADLLTKNLPSGEKRLRFVKLYFIYLLLEVKTMGMLQQLQSKYYQRNGLRLLLVQLNFRIQCNSPTTSNLCLYLYFILSLVQFSL